MKQIQRLFVFAMGAILLTANAHAGRWITRDPMEVQEHMERDPHPLLDLNPYTFVGNNPISNIDPFGLAYGDWYDPRTWFGMLPGGVTALPNGDLFMAGPSPSSSITYGGLYGIDLSVTGGKLPGDFVADNAVEVGKNSVVAMSMVTPLGPLGEGEGAYAAAAKALEAARAAKVARAAKCAKSLLNANPVGSALKADKYHRAATFMREAAAQSGSHFDIVGADGITRTLTQIPGKLDGIAGRFEYIVDQVGNLTHQLFVPNGTINGVPIVP